MIYTVVCLSAFDLLYQFGEAGNKPYSKDIDVNFNAWNWKEKRYMEMENFFFDNSGHLSLKGILFYVHSMHKIPLRDLK